MTMSKAALKKYAEIGVRERLREIQRELDVLARDFPELVRNADGAMPSVMPIVRSKPTKAAARAPRANTRDRQQQAAAYLATHPGSTAAAIASAIGIRMSGTVRDHILKPIATATGEGTSAEPRRWTLKGTHATNGSGRPLPRKRGTLPTRKTRGLAGPKILRQRQASAKLLDQFDTATPHKIKSPQLGILIQRGYLARKDDGYIRTAKPYHVNPSSANAS